MGRKGYGQDWTEATIRRPLESLYRSGMTYEQIAERLDLDISNVRRWVSRLGLRGRSWAVTADERRALLGMYEEQSMTVVDIHHRTGRSRSTIRQHLRRGAAERGVPLRPPVDTIYEKRLAGLRRLHGLPDDWRPQGSRS